MKNQMKNKCASMKCLSRKSNFLCRCDQISLNYFETKMSSMMCEKNENAFEMQIKNKNVFAVKKLKITQSVVFFEIKNLLHLCLKKLSALFFFVNVFFEVFELVVFIFLLQNCFDLAIFHSFDFKIKSINNNNWFIYLFEICVSSFFSMIFLFVDNAFGFFELVNFVMNLKSSFNAYKNKSIKIFSSDDSNISIASRIKEQNLINRELANLLQNFSYFDI